MWALKRDFPELEFSLNGVVQDCHEAAAALQHEEAGARLHGVMIGRAAYHGPWASLGDADRAVFGAAANASANRREVRSSLHLAWKSRVTPFRLVSRFAVPAIQCSASSCTSGMERVLSRGGAHYDTVLTQAPPK